jgi:hypothetical protein
MVRLHLVLTLEGKYWDKNTSAELLLEWQYKLIQLGRPAGVVEDRGTCSWDDSEAVLNKASSITIVLGAPMCILSNGSWNILACVLDCITSRRLAGTRSYLSGEEGGISAFGIYFQASQETFTTIHVSNLLLFPIPSNGHTSRHHNKSSVGE